MPPTNNSNKVPAAAAMPVPNKHIAIKIIAALFIIAVLFVAAIFYSAWRATGAPLKVAQTFFYDISHGQYPDGYALLSSRLHKVGSEVQFAADMGAMPILKASPTVVFNVQKVQNNAALMTGVATGADKVTTRVAISLIKEGGSWKIDGIVMPEDKARAAKAAAPASATTTQATSTRAVRQ